MTPIVEIQFQKAESCEKQVSGNADGAILHE